ncbi:MAG: SipW-dependent-type signal peptide-containing protein [Clostridia bacterium]|nr:SipW-dependent-type signal peptide-containing protein [Clostridia bacterium]
MKKKIFAIALVAILAVTAITGASLAYLQDTDDALNTFTVGNVEIDLYENFDEDLAHLLPAVYDADTQTYNNSVTKEVFVKNTGDDVAYVRVHIAIPSILDDAQPNFDASKNVLHFNFAPESVADGLWSWNKTVDGANYPTNASEWNSYPTTIDGVAYNVYVVTFKSSLDSEASTCSAMNQVYLDPKTTNGDIAKINETLKGEWNIYVAAEGVQAAGFKNAFHALDTAFGVPGTYDVAWTATDDTSNG